MAKFYVQSGEFRSVVQAETAAKAALWAMHLAMESCLPLDELDLSDDQRADLQFADDVSRLGLEMSLSEIGFGRIDAGVKSTIDVMVEWNQLTMAVADLSSGVARHDRS